MFFKKNGVICTLKEAYLITDKGYVEIFRINKKNTKVVAEIVIFCPFSKIEQIRQLSGHNSFICFKIYNGQLGRILTIILTIFFCWRCYSSKKCLIIVVIEVIQNGETGKKNNLMCPTEIEIAVYFMIIWSFVQIKGFCLLISFGRLWEFLKYLFC